MKWKQGDRVQRLHNIYDKNSTLMCGTVINVYSKTIEIAKEPKVYKELVDVQWDGIVLTYLPHGLEPEGSTHEYTQKKTNG